jgi:hypothetical protein
MGVRKAASDIDSIRVFIERTSGFTDIFAMADKPVDGFFWEYH